jgi:hypothetical protein
MAGLKRNARLRVPAIHAFTQQHRAAAGRRAVLEGAAGTAKRDHILLAMAGDLE